MYLHQSWRILVIWSYQWSDVDHWGCIALREVLQLASFGGCHFALEQIERWRFCSPNAHSNMRLFQSSDSMIIDSEILSAEENVGRVATTGYNLHLLDGSRGQMSESCDCSLNLFRAVSLHNCINIGLCVKTAYILIHNAAFILLK